MSLKIGVFDSGAGGLTVLSSLRQLLPQHHYLYIEDAGFAPYGSQSPDLIIERCFKVAHYLCQQDITAIVVACNTATVTAIHLLRQQFQHLPIVGIEPAVKPAYQLTQNGKIMVLATPATISSARLRMLIEQWGVNKETTLFASDTLAALIDRQDNNVALECELDRIADEVIVKGVDVLVLACTHYPHVSSQLQQRLPGVHIIEPSVGVAQRLAALLPVTDPACHGDVGSEQFFTTGKRKGLGRYPSAPKKIVL